jgi:hypothetical protein
MLIGWLALESVDISMTTVLTKSFPQEKPAATKAVPSNKHVLIVDGFAGIAGDAATMTQDGHPVLESGHLRSSGFVT